LVSATPRIGGGSDLLAYSASTTTYLDPALIHELPHIGHESARR
jgi:hypothetical protein